MPGILGADASDSGVERGALPGLRPFPEGVEAELAPDAAEAAHHEQPPVLERIGGAAKGLGQEGRPHQPELRGPLSGGLGV
eukprot:15443756-Alexandrium_andersonii.AAC.1